jgi:putative phosphoribosyl transferase
VARQLNDAGLGTLLFDLLTVEEARDRANVFDVELLADRLRAVARWVRRQAGCEGLGVGYFGASTGAAAALVAAADDPDIRVVVSRGGRPDLATVHRDAATRLSCEHRIAVVRGATHLFEEPGTLETVAHLACDWFLRFLRGDD